MLLQCATEHLKNSAVLHRFCCFSKVGLHAQAGVGLMALQQLGGVNGILFYASEVFVSAGNDMNNDNFLP